VGPSETALDDNASASLPTVRTLLRALLAACVALSPLVVALSFVADPTGDVPHGANNIYTTFGEAGAERVELFLFLNAAAAYLFPLSYIGMGLVALRRSPWLAALGMIAGLLGTLQWGIFVPIEALFAVMAKSPNGSDFIPLANAVSAEGVIVYFQLAWVIGHLLGFALLGVALWQARVIPRRAAALIVLGVPLQALAYPLNLGVLQIVGFLLVFVGSSPVALALLRIIRTR
jgi:hypothetical protein